MGFLRGFLLSLTLGWIIIRIFNILVFLRPGTTIFEHKPGPCHVIEGANEGSEDMVMLPGGKVIISSGLRWRTNRFPDRTGRILLYDFKQPKTTQELKLIWKDPEYFAKFNPHGIDAFTTKEGKTIVFVVNHIPHEAIERFDLDLNKKTLTHLESINDPTMHLMNSVIAVDERSFFFSNYMYRRDGILAELEIPLDLRYGSIASYDGQTNSGKILQSGCTMPNGLALSRDKTKLYLAAVGQLSIDTFNITSLTNVSLANSFVIGTVIDNIQTDPTDGSLWLGCHPAPFRSALYLEKPDELISPAQVLKVKVDNNGFPLADDVTEVYSNRGDEISASSVAVHYEKKVLIGSISHNTVMCEIKN